MAGALGLSMADLFIRAKSGNNRAATNAEAVYQYLDKSGKLLVEVIRYPGKEFLQRRPDGRGGWHWNLNGVPRVLYRLPEVIKAKSLLVCEGERDCETARRLGIVATTNPHGAGKWRREYAAFLKGKEVCILADADPPGLAHGREVARSLLNVAASVKLIETLPSPGAKDLSDFAATFPDPKTCRETLDALIAEAPLLTAADVANWQPAKSGGFTLTPLSELLKKPNTPVEFILEDHLVAGTVSGVFAKPKVGKGTLARNLCLAVARGEDFLGLYTKQGECIYLALEEREEDVRDDFRAMGADGSEPILIHAAAAPAEGIGALCELVRERAPRLVVIDPLFRLAHVKDEKAYAETYSALGPLIDAARETGTHVMLLHHSGKSTKTDPTDSPLGSTAIAGVVATLIVLKRRESYRTVQTVQRIGDEMPEAVLQFDPETKRLSIGGTREEAETQTLSGEILEFLEAAGQPKTEPEITKGVEGKTKFVRRALRQLVEQGKVSREGGGKRGDPYHYRFPFSCSQDIAGTRERETESGGQTRTNTGEMLVPENGQVSFVVPGPREPEKPPAEGMPLEGEL